MPKRQDLKRKLKASDRRRRRRADSPAAAPVPAKSPTPSVDTSDLIVRAVLDQAHSSTEIRDANVVAAFRSCLRGTIAGDEPTRGLCQRLDGLLQTNGVTLNSFRGALKQLVDLAGQHRDPKNTTAFLHYLALLAE